MATGVPRHPDGRSAVFLGDLVDRGPDTPGVLRPVMAMVAAGTALCVPGNHEHKLLRALRGRDVQVSHGLAESLAQLEAEPDGFRNRVVGFLDGLISHYVLDGGRLVVAHAGLPSADARARLRRRCGPSPCTARRPGRPTSSGCRCGTRGRRTTGAARWSSTATPRCPSPTWLNNTICLDTGCVFGGRLTALRYPERELVSVTARRVYFEPERPLAGAGCQPARLRGMQGGRLLDVADVLGRRGVETRLRGRVPIPEQNAAAALEVMSRFAVDPRWLIYLPPTMAPVPASPANEHPGLLEHPAEALAAYRRDAVTALVCEEKHMGSRAVVIVCRTPEAALDWFGTRRGGIVYTRTGRRFFPDAAMEDALLHRLNGALAAAGLWDELGDWAALDCEIMPWSLKADDLVRGQYAAVGAAAVASLAAASEVVAAAGARGLEMAGLGGRTRQRLAAAQAFTGAYHPYVWPVSSLDDVRLAPFQVLAGSTGICYERPHAWHMQAAQRLSHADGLIAATRHLLVDTSDAGAEAAVTAWWEEITGTGGEGMVVKPATPVTRGRRGLAQPGLKCRGPEYLRIIYGPEYTLPGNLDRLRERHLGRKRSLAISEFALGVEALERFVRREPAFRVHECVFGVLALESEPVDPRL